MSTCTLPLPPTTDPLINVFDALPLPVLVVDPEVRIIDFNLAAARLLESIPFAVLRGCGEGLHCIQGVESPGGCGSAEACEDCVIRNCVREAFSSGRLCRQTGRLILLKEGEPVEVDFIVTAAPVPDEPEPLVLLTLDDAAEVSRLLEAKGRGRPACRMR